MLVLVGTAALLPAPGSAEGPPVRGLPAPPRLSEAARGILRRRMQRHGEEMRALSLSVVLLDYENAAARADAIVGEPMLARPLTGDATELNTTLPERFFQLQDELKLDARRLAWAARTRNATEMADAYGQLARTCVGCHSAYLQGGPAPR